MPLGFGRLWGAVGGPVWQAIVPAGGRSGRRPTDHSRSSQVFPGFVSRWQPAAKPGKFVAYGEGGLKGRLQARLPATRKTKGERQA